jgi:hypothetical protein
MTPLAISQNGGHNLTKENQVDPTSGQGPEIPSGDEPSKEKGTVAYETYQKVLAEKKARDARLKDAEVKIAAFEKAQQLAEEAKLQEQGQFKTLLENEKALRIQREEELTGLKTGLANSIKRQTLEEKLGGKLKKSEYAAFIPFDRITMDENMRVDEASVTEVAEFFAKEHKELIDFRTQGATPPGTAPKSSPKLSYDSWLKLPLKEQKARMHELIKK